MARLLSPAFVKRPAVFLIVLGIVAVSAELAWKVLDVSAGLQAEYSADLRSGRAVRRVIDPEISTTRISAAWNNSPPATFVAQWSGFLVLARAGWYTFATTSDDGSRVVIDGHIVVDNTGDHGVQTRTGRIRLKSGSHAVLVDYVQSGGGYAMNWSSARDGSAPTPIPSWALWTKPIGSVHALAARFTDAVRSVAAIAFVLMTLCLTWQRRGHVIWQATRRFCQQGRALVEAGGSQIWMAASWLVVAGFLAAVAQSYHPPFGFTQFIGFTTASHAEEIEVVRNTPHFDNRGGGYDGVFYAQLALEPLLRNMSIDRAMDSAPYRARRILMPWVAYLAGLGRPFWVLQAYAFLNVVVWLVLAWLLARSIPPVNARGFVLWAGCMLSSGLLFSVRLALPDGPSVLLVVLAVGAAERGRPVVASLLIGAAGLMRETSVLAATMLARVLRRDVRSWLLVAGCLFLCVLPIALWLDYLRSIYRSFTLAGGDQVMAPFAGFAWKVQSVAADLRRTGATRATVSSLVSCVAFFAQGVWVVIELVRRDGRSPWAIVAGSFLLLALTTTRPVWEGSPGAFTRAFLPLSIGANVLLARRPHAWWGMIAAANLGVVSGLLLLVVDWA
jgi:hypothetical protein